MRMFDPTDEDLVPEDSLHYCHTCGYDEFDCICTKECDCCGKQKPRVRQCWLSGLETWACERCRGHFDED